jgi:membrane associated rhomboid family serine protease
MIPLRDNIPARRFPLVNTAIIMANVLIFLFQISMGPGALQRFVYGFGLVPAEFFALEGPGRWLPIFSSMFLHGGWLHLISNILALYIFGDNVEDRMGHGRYLIFYLLGGVIAGLAHAWTNAASGIPTVGASGAIAAVLGAYLVLFPRARVVTLIPLPIFLFFPLIEIPALLYLGFWFFSQLFNGAFALAADTFQGGGVAWWAHIGGFVAGLILGRLFAAHRPPPPPPRLYRRDEYSPW